MSKLVLGLNTDHGDSAAVLVSENGPIAGMAEERINRKKHCADFPALSIQEVMRLAGASASDITAIAIARDPKANWLQKAAFIAKYPKHGASLARRRLSVHRGVANTKFRVAEALGVDEARIKADLYQVEHHLAHVASAFYWSHFDRATALTIDGAGDFATSMSALCRGTKINVLGRSHWPHSLGVFYTAICQFIGFDRYGEEFKVMGLSAYGRNRYSRFMRELVKFDPAHGIRLNLDYFRHHHGQSLETIKDGVVTLPTLWGEKIAAELGPPRDRNTELTERENDLAASMQARYEEVFLDMVHHTVAQTGIRDAVFSGGCALNSVANGRMLGEGYVDRAYFHPAATDDGTAMGAAHYVLHNHLGAGRCDPVDHSYFGTSYTDDEIAPALENCPYPVVKLEREALLQRAAEAMQHGKIMGWFQGPEEWGPRALGNRSILCNPAWPDMKATLNARIKNREHFRPFAPVVRGEDLEECFEGTGDVPFMIVVYKVRPEWRARLQAVTHEDGTGRVQTVRRDQNPIYYDLITKFKELTGVPVILNTSFNENEPIVHTPAQALACFERTKMDCLAIGSYWVEKSAS